MSEDSDAPGFSNGGDFINNKGTAEQHLPGPNDKVYDLVDIVDEMPKKIHTLTDIVAEPEILQNKEPQDVLVIDGRGYEKEAQPEEKIHDLIEIEEDKPAPAPELTPGLPEEEMKKIIAETVERLAREMIPDIAERVIREEIEKLKQEAEEEIV